MKKTILLNLVLFLNLSVFAQEVSVSRETTGYREPIKNKNLIKEVKTNNKPKLIKDAAVIGCTINYDFQTNSSMQRRINIHNDGSMSATWIMSFDESTSDRGTGYNYFDGNAWDTQPSSRIESERTGWPALLDLGHNVVIAHGPADGSALMSQNSQYGASDWSESYIQPGPSPMEIVWPRAAVGGPNGNTIHMIASTYNAVNGNVLVAYYRSLNGGTTWDKSGEILSGIGPTKYSNIDGDDYALDVDGETVAIAIFCSTGDVAVLKSNDNGDSWTRYTVLDFPDQYEPFDESTDVFDIDQDGVPDTTSKSDGSGTVIIDHQGTVHVAFGLLLGTFDGDNYSFPALSDGIVYWNENMPEGQFSNDFIVSPSRVYLHNNLDTIAKAPDPNNNGIIDWLGSDPSMLYFGLYNTSLTSTPMFALDYSNNLYMVYSTIMEEYYSTSANPNAQHFRHVHGMVKPAGSNTWVPPVNLVQETGISNDTENVFPSIARELFNGKLHLIWQNDSEPGNTINDADLYTNNNIIYDSYDASLFLSNPTYYTVTFHVTDYSTGYPISGADINIGGNIITTDDSGEAYTNLINGIYTYEVTAPGYNTVNSTVTVDDGAVTEYVTMEEIVDYTVTFIVNVDDNPYSAAEIEIDGNTLYTNSNGIATIDLVDGTYNYVVNIDDLPPYNSSITVAGEPVTEELNLYIEYDVTFSVISSEDSDPIEGANIQIAGETLTTSQEGLASTLLINGEYDFSISANEYLDYNDSLIVESNSVFISIALQPDKVSEVFENKLGIYPNPAKTFVKINSTVPSELEILSITGNTLISKTLKKGKEVINISFLQSGIYIIKLKDQTNLKTYKLLKK